ncbi:MAG: hypothetical protein HWE24_21310 [Oceanospirillaceae bacterium]|nr:hypothetical protein [Oceanospirillaceae bacterium]
MIKVDEFIWDGDYVRTLIKELSDKGKVLNQIIDDNQETFDDWKSEDLYESMVDLTKEQIDYLNY